MEGKTKEDAEKSGIIERLVKKHLLLNTGATRHPFILSIRNGTVNLSSFKTWLGQDFVFVREFVPFVASVLIKASKNSDESNDDMEVILRGLASLRDELSWFKQEASKWGVSPSNITVHKANQNYCRHHTYILRRQLKCFYVFDESTCLFFFPLMFWLFLFLRFLESLMLPEVEYAVAVTAFWAIEAVYQESFAHCLEDGNKTPSELYQTCQRWGNDGFGEYCRALQKIANRCLEKASDDVRAKGEVTLLDVLEHEIEFWNMSQGRT